MIKKILLLVLSFALLIAQPGYPEIETLKSTTISGFVRDARTGETLNGAVIYPKEIPVKGITSNSYGYYSLTLPTGKYTFIIQYLGYKTQTIEADLKENLKVDVDMLEESITIKEITVTGERRSNNVVSNESISKINVKEIQNIPVILGGKGYFENHPAPAWHQTSRGRKQRFQCSGRLGRPEPDFGQRCGSRP